MKPWEETWKVEQFGYHNDVEGRWYPQIEMANCRHDPKCTCGTFSCLFERTMADGFCDDGADFLGRATLAAAAPDLYRALEELLQRDECLCKGNIIPGGPCRHEKARAALKKARGQS